MKTISCPICQNRKSIHLWSHARDRFLMRVGNHSRIRDVVCAGCGVAYANPQLESQEIESLYTGFYREDEELGESHFSNKEQQARDRIGWLLDRCPLNAGRMLEIGCSEGTLLRQLRDEHGWTVSGFEPNGYTARHGMETWQLEIETGFFRSDLCAGKFDVVTLIHVIEHLPDPVAFLVEIGSVLNDGGYFFFETPNMDSPRVGRISADLFASPHLVIFSPQTIELALNKAGFELVALESTHNLRGLARWRGGQIQAKSGQPARATQTAVRYRYWAIREFQYFAARSLKSFLVQTAIRCLGEQRYRQLRSRR